MKEHNWSGWPGAFCLDCGAEDMIELCIAEHEVSITCIHGHLMCEEGHPMQKCEIHKNDSCPGPRS